MGGILMLTPLRQWYCDVCDEVIENPETGYVIWKTDDRLLKYDFKIIHKARCDLDDHQCSMEVGKFLGLDGITRCLSFLSLGPVKATLGSTWQQVRDIDEFVDLVRRLQTPYYEEARRLFTEQELLERLSDASESFPYFSASCEKFVCEARN
jgi:hypothetical protein